MYRSTESAHLLRGHSEFPFVTAVLVFFVLSTRLLFLCESYEIILKNKDNRLIMISTIS